MKQAFQRIVSAIKQTVADAGAASPTSSMYFSEPLAHLIGRSNNSSKKLIRQISATLFVYGKSAVIIRCVNRSDLIFLANQYFEKIYYLIDDNLFVLGCDDGLPADYRKRLHDYRESLLKDFLPFITHVVAPSPLILESYKGKIHHLLHPARCHQSGSLDHHRNYDSFDIVFAATRSHVKDIEMITPQLVQFLDQNPKAKLTTFLGRHAPKSLLDVRNVRHHKPMSWPEYRRFSREHRFHVAVAPAVETLFNRSRSISRLHDHSAFGAVGLHSAIAPFSKFVDHGYDGFLVGPSSTEWYEVLSGLISLPDNLRPIAAAGQAKSASLGNIEHVRDFWIRELSFN